MLRTLSRSIRWHVVDLWYTFTRIPSFWKTFTHQLHDPACYSSGMAGTYDTSCMHIRTWFCAGCGFGRKRGACM